MSNKRILYKFCSRERPNKFFACLDNIISSARHNNYIILCSLDTDDVSMNNDEVKEQLSNYGNRIKVCWGTSENKVSAINRDVEQVEDWDILLNHSDDMWFTKFGFDLDVLEAFENFDGLVHFPDQKAGNKLITYAMMSRGYYDLHGYIYNPEFESVYCDNFQQDQAKALGKYKFVDKQILEHRHFIWGYGHKDELLERTENPRTYAKDRDTYHRLKSSL